MDGPILIPGPSSQRGTTQPVTQKDSGVSGEISEPEEGLHDDELYCWDNEIEKFTIVPITLRRILQKLDRQDVGRGSNLVIIVFSGGVPHQWR